MNLVGYARVSTREQGESGAGLGAQLSAIGDYCNRNEHTFVVRQDVQSGANMHNRDGLLGALEALQEGHFDGLIVAKLDRLSRSVMDFATMLAASRKHRWRLIVVDIGVDTSTPTGELIAGILMDVAQWERRIIGQRTREGLAQKKAEGVRIGRPPRPMDERLVRELHDHATSTGGNRKSWAALARHLTWLGIPTIAGAEVWTPLQVKRAAARLELPSAPRSAQPGYRGRAA